MKKCVGEIIEKQCNTEVIEEQEFIPEIINEQECTPEFIEEQECIPEHIGSQECMLEIPQEEELMEKQNFRRNFVRVIRDIVQKPFSVPSTTDCKEDEDNIAVLPPHKVRN